MPKRGENIYKRKDGRYEARYVKERDDKGRILKYGFVYDRSYIGVKRKREEEIKNIKNKDKLKIKYNDDIFDNVITEWLDTKMYIKGSSYTNYYSIINSKIKPFFTGKHLSNINEKIILDFISHLQKENLSNKRIKDILIVLKQFLEYKNIHIKFKMPKVSKNRIVTLKETEVETIEKKTISTDEIKDFAILLVLFSGLRIGELCALKWQDIDFENEVIHVSKTIIRIKNKTEGKSKTRVIIDTPKTENSIRDIPIHSSLINYLKKFKKDKNTYFLTGNNDFITTQKYYLYYQKFLKRYAISDYKFHVLRHTFATRALLNGMDVKTLSEILGHSSVKITLDCYVHITDEEKLIQINKLPLLTLS